MPTESNPGIHRKPRRDEYQEISMRTFAILSLVNLGLIWALFELQRTPYSPPRDMSPLLGTEIVYVRLAIVFLSVVQVLMTTCFHCGASPNMNFPAAATLRFITDPSLIFEEKLDGTNVGLHFSDVGEMILQCRGHLITECMHPKYDLLKQWAAVKRHFLERRFENRFILFGEWLYARHTVAYRQLTHYFFEFDIYDKQQQVFLDLGQRRRLLENSGIQTVPVIHSGSLKRSKLESLIGPSLFDSLFDNPMTMRTDNLMEGLYLSTEAHRVTLSVG
jgi:hypothetical protein